jgi:putative mycofactocin binding protein MftB
LHNTRYKLAPGSQVREEAFGLLFYTMGGPRLYFVSSGDMLKPEFFHGACSLERWIDEHFDGHTVPYVRITEMQRCLDFLRDKGVIFEC